MIDVLFNLKNPNWYYIIAISFQLAGAILLLIRFWGNGETTLLKLYYNGGEEIANIKGTVTLEKKKLRECAREIYMNRFSFLYIITGYVVGVFGDLTLPCKGCVAFTIMIVTGCFMVIAYIVSWLISRCTYGKDIEKDYEEIRKATGKEANFVEFL